VFALCFLSPIKAFELLMGMKYMSYIDGRYRSLFFSDSNKWKTEENRINAMCKTILPLLAF